MLKGDSDPWRDIGHARWHDPYAAYEDPTSPQFKTALEKEATHFEEALKPLKSKAHTRSAQFKADFEVALPNEPAAAQEVALWQGRTLFIQHAPGHRLHVWIFEAGKHIRTFNDLESFGTDPDSSHYFVIQDVGNGDQTFQLSVFRLEAHSPQYTIDNVGPRAAFAGDYLYFLGTENILRSNALFEVNKTNGRGRSKLYEEKDKRFNLTLHAPPRQRDIFLRRENALSQQLGRVVKGSLKWFTPPPHKDGAGNSLVPIAEGVYASDTTLTIHGRSYTFPHKQFLVDAVPFDASQTLVAVGRNGQTNVYKVDATGYFHPLSICTIPGSVMFHGHSSVPSYTRTYYNAPNTVFEIQENTVNKVRQGSALELKRAKTGHARSADGTQVPYTFVSRVQDPRKLLVTAYGAYGISSNRAYPLRWIPWLRAGYAVVEAMPRGGRENGDAWYDGARTALRKRHTFEDVAAVIKAVQARFHFQKENTVIYGRSAGGWNAAYIGLRYADLVAAVYAEVPYLDVVRTTTNPALPLTILEYDEFGNPADRPEEYAALQTLSPVDIATAAPKDAPFFLIRTALHDSQVFPYEALKFGAKVRGLGWPIVVGVDSDGGHFTKIKNMYSMLGEDFALLDSVVKSRVSRRKTRRHARSRLRAQRSIGTMRRSRSSLKH